LYIKKKNTYSLLYIFRLEHLSLRRCAIGEKGAMLLANELCENYYLKTLDLSSNALRSDGAHAISVVSIAIIPVI
jgi:hypothetical protein